MSMEGHTSGVELPRHFRRQGKRVSKRIRDGVDASRRASFIENNSEIRNQIPLGPEDFTLRLSRLSDTLAFATNFTMNICYLDYDAVLHDGNVLRNRTKGMTIKTPGRTFFEWMPILEELLAPYPDLRIVLSTTWVRELGFKEAKLELSASLQDRVIGSTFLHPEIVKAEFDTMSRGMQILGDVKRRKPAHWFALDDDAYGWPARHRENLIQTNTSLGLSDPAVQEKVRQKLADIYCSGSAH